jgi:hypothetical protein
VKIYRTNGKEVILLQGTGVAVHWIDEASPGSDVDEAWAVKAAFTSGWREMDKRESCKWQREMPRRVPGIPADDWQGMYHVAAKRAQVAEDALAAVRKAVQASEVKPLPPGTYYTEHVEHATKISEARRLALVEIRGILGMEGVK